MISKYLRVCDALELKDQLWILRKCCVWACLIIISFFGYHFIDYPVANNKILLDVAERSKSIFQLLQSKTKQETKLAPLPTKRLRATTPRRSPRRPLAERLK